MHRLEKLNFWVSEGKNKHFRCAAEDKIFIFWKTLGAANFFLQLSWFDFFANINCPLFTVFFGFITNLIANIKFLCYRGKQSLPFLIATCYFISITNKFYWSVWLASKLIFGGKYFRTRQQQDRNFSQWLTDCNKIIECTHLMTSQSEADVSLWEKL